MTWNAPNLDQATSLTMENYIDVDPIHKPS